MSGILFHRRADGTRPAAAWSHMIHSYEPAPGVLVKVSYRFRSFSGRIARDRTDRSRSWLKRFRKLLRMSSAELRVRGGQALAVLQERLGTSEQLHLPNAERFFTHLLDGRALRPSEWNAGALRRHLRERRAPRFFDSFSDPKRTLATLRRYLPDHDTAVEQAHRIADGRFDLLGPKTLDFGDPIRWRLDPSTGKETPLRHWSRIRYLDPNVAGDYKLTWELNRQQYLVTLGKAYWYTADESFAARAVDHLCSWMDANPPKRGINWASSLELAYRAISWIWTLQFLKNSEQLSPEKYLRCLKYLYLHGRHIETYLSTFHSPNTHLTGEALGLFYLGIVFPELRAAARWRRTGLRILTSEITRHIGADGVYCEQATYYQRYTVDIYLHLWALSSANRLAVSPAVKRRLELALEYLLFLARPDGSAPLLGDDDGGRLLPLDNRPPCDFRACLATGAVLFGRSDFRFAAGEPAEETLWLLGPEGFERFLSLTGSAPRRDSRGFPQGGCFVMRDGWEQGANYLLVQCGPHGFLNCGHAHDDLLAIEVAAAGKRVLVDPGTYTYTACPDLRDYFRSARAHSSVTVDGESASAAAGPFGWRRVTDGSLIQWLCRERFDYFSGSRTGFGKSCPRAHHQRSILFVKGGYWVVRDVLSMRGRHRASVHFHFAPEIEVRRSDDALLASERADGDSLLLHIQAFGPAGSFGVERGWFSPAYGHIVPSPTATYTTHATGRQDLVTFLVPSPVSGLSIRALDTISGCAFAVEYGDTRDVLLLDQARLANGLWDTDAQVCWVRVASGAEAPRELLLIGGSRLGRRGESILRSAVARSFVSVWSTDGLVRFDTDRAGGLDIGSLDADSRGNADESRFALPSKKEGLATVPLDSSEGSTHVKDA